MTGQQIADRLLRRRRGILRVRVQEQLVPAIGADHHTAAKALVHLVLDPMRAQVLDCLARLTAGVQADGHPPVVVVGRRHVWRAAACHGILVSVTGVSLLRARAGRLGSGPDGTSGSGSLGLATAPIDVAQCPHDHGYHQVRHRQRRVHRTG